MIFFLIKIEDINIHVNLSKEATKNYERELVLHAMDVQSLRNANDQLQSAEQKIEQLKVFFTLKKLSIFLT